MGNDWIAIRNEYINGNIGYRKLAEKHGVSFATLRGRAESEQWVAQRTAQQHKISMETAQKTAQELINQTVNRTMEQMKTSDRLNRMLNRALDQLEQSGDIPMAELDRAASVLKKIQEIQRTAEGKEETSIIINHSIPRAEDDD